MLRETELENLASQAIAIDAADKIADEGLLLTLLNLLVEKEGQLLLTSHTPPPLWRVQSADLASRLKAMPVAEIDAPDEATLKTRLKAAARRHYLRLEPDVLSYVAPRLGRTYSDVEGFVVKLSEAVSQTGRAPSVYLARAVLEEAAIGDLYDE
jgi:chromosomal replication initiation ATPase DnaA